MASIEVKPSPEGVPGPVRDPARVRGEQLTLPSADGTEINGYLARPADDGERVGCIGFGMGGRYTLLFACSSEQLNAAVDCWGGFIDKAAPDERSTPRRPVPPLELADGLRCPLLAAVGAEDQNPSPAIGAQLLERARTSGQEVKLDVYEGAGHAFFADYRPTYRPEPTA